MSIVVFFKISTSIPLQVLEDFDVTFYSFYQGSRRILQLLKWPCHTSFFTHVEPFIWFNSWHFISVTCTYETIAALY